jgi:hypothetical protein
MGRNRVVLANVPDPATDVSAAPLRHGVDKRPLRRSRRPELTSTSGRARTRRRRAAR